MASIDNDQGNPEVSLTSGHTIRDAPIHYQPVPSARPRMSPNPTPARQSPPNPPTGRRTSPGLVNDLAEPGTKDRVDELEASFDVIDGLVTSLSDLAMCSEVGEIFKYFDVINT